MENRMFCYQGQENADIAGMREPKYGKHASALLRDDSEVDAVRQWVPARTSGDIKLFFG